MTCPPDTVRDGMRLHSILCIGCITKHKILDGGDQVVGRVLPLAAMGRCGRVDPPPYIRETTCLRKFSQLVALWLIEATDVVARPPRYSVRNRLCSLR